jgi:hypothetical protein
MAEQSDAREALVAVLSAVGMGVGNTLVGWAVASVDRTHEGDAALSFTRGRAHVEVRIEPAVSGRACFAQVGEVQLSHLPVEPALTRYAGELMRAVVACLEARTKVTDLRALLEAPANRLPAAPQPEAGGAYSVEADAPELDPSLEASSERPFMRFLTLGLDELGALPDALRHMYEGTLGGMVIKDVYSKDAMSAVMDRLRARDAELPRTSFPARFKAHFYGRCLDGADPALDEYLRDAARLRTELTSVFAGHAAFEDRVEEVFRMLAGGRRVELPTYADGRAYTPATVRILLEGGQIGTHCGNEAATRPAYSHLNTRIDKHDQLSYFLTLQHAEAGGELIVYSLKWSDIDASHIVGGRSQVDDLLRTAQWIAVRPSAGELLIFDGGRYFHRVSKVVGARIRYTIGGFLMFRADGEAIYYWS